MYWADENVRGLSSPGRGTETCSVVETMFSLRTAYEVTGNISFMDRLERIAFNALPAALWPDVTANVYHHASNMIAVTRDPWSYGLYFCCTANVHQVGRMKSASFAMHVSRELLLTIPVCGVWVQGWPKFVLSAVQIENSTAAIVISGYSPSVSTLPDDGCTVTITGNYPFSDDVAIQLGGGNGVRHLKLRIPCWVESASVLVDGHSVGVGQPCSFFSTVAASGSTIQISFQNEIKVRVWHNSTVDGQSAINEGAVEIHRGALLFALRPQSTVNESIVNPAFPTIKNRAVEINPGQTWAYGLKLETLRFVSNGSVPSIPFDAAADPPVKIQVAARAVPQWTTATDPPPLSPLSSAEQIEQIELVPYGSTNIRISVFPQICEPKTDHNCKMPPPHPAPPRLPPNGQFNTNEPNNDLVHGGFSVGLASNLTTAASACFDQCRLWNTNGSKKGQCHVYTFASSKPNPSGPDSGPWCWLKSAVNPVPMAGFISGECALNTAFPCPTAL